MINVNEITTTLRGMPDRLLQQYAMMNKANPYVLSLAVAESNQRKQLRQAAQARAAAPQPKVADAAIAGMVEEAPAVDAMGNVTGMAAGGLPEDYGIGRLPAPNMQSMADGGIAGYGDGDDVPKRNGMAMGGMFDFAQRSEPVVRMAEGGVPGYAKGVYNSDRFREYLKAIGMTGSEFANADAATKQKVLSDFGDVTSGPQKAAAPAAPAPAAATPSNAGKAYEAGKALKPYLDKTGKLVKTGAVPVVGGGLAALSATSELDSAKGFYDDPNVPMLEKAKQFSRTAANVGLPYAGGAVGAGLTSWMGGVPGAVGGAGLGTALASVIDDEGEALKAWKKANPQATPEQAKKAVAEATVPEAAPEAAPDTGIKTLVPSSTGTGENLAPSKAPTIEDATALGDKFFNSKARIADINRQVLQEQMDANTSKENSIAALKAFNEKQGPAYAGYEQLLKKEELQDATDKEKAGLMSLMKGFLAMAAGESPNAATNIAKGAMAGMGDYGDALKEFKKAAKERNKEMQNIEQARRAEERGDFKEVRMYEDRADAARQASARFGIAATNDILNTSGKVSADIYNTLATNTSRENVAKMGERGANARASTPEKILFDQLRAKYGGDAVRATEEIQKLKAEKFNVYDAYTKYLMAFANKEGVSPPMEFDQFATKFIPTVTPNKNTTVRTQPGG